MSTADIKNYKRKPFDVRAVRVTPMNIEEVAKWCGGVIREGEKEGQLSRKFIKVRVQFPMTEKQTEAHIGDWVVKAGRTFKVYGDRAFRKTFSYPNGQEVEVEEIPKETSAPNPNSMPKKKTVQEEQAEYAAQQAIAAAEPVPTDGGDTTVTVETTEHTAKGGEGGLSVAPPPDSTIGGKTFEEHNKVEEEQPVNDPDSVSNTVPQTVPTVRPGDEPSPGEVARGEI